MPLELERLFLIQFLRVGGGERVPDLARAVAERGAQRRRVAHVALEVRRVRRDRGPRVLHGAAHVGPFI